MEQSQEKINYDEVMQNDAEAIDAFIKNFYVKSVPEPPRPTKEDLSFWRIAGLESSFFVLSAIGAALLSSLRTGGFFLLLEVSLVEKYELPPILASIFGWVALITSLLTFEGFILGFGLKKGRESGKLHVSWWGMVMAMVTILAASIFSGFSIVSMTDSQRDTMNLLMALITGIGASGLGYFSTENLGFILNSVTSKKNEIISNHQRVFGEWRAAAVETYLTSAYNIRHKRSEKIYGANKPSSPQPTRPNQSEEDAHFEHQQAVNKNKKKSKVDIGYDFVKMFYKKSKRLPTNREIQSGTGVAVGTAFTALSLFIVENKDELIKKQMVSEKQLEKAISHVRKSTEQNQPEPEALSYQDTIRNLIDVGKSFPTVESVMSETGLDYNSALREMLVYVSENQQFLIESSILTEQQVNDAVSQLN